MAHPVAYLSLAVVAAIAAVLAVMAYRSYLATGAKRLLYLMGAFTVFAFKGALTSWALAAEAIGHETLEVVNGGLDLLIVLLLMAPFLHR